MALRPRPCRFWPETRERHRSQQRGSAYAPCSALAGPRPPQSLCRPCRRATGSRLSPSPCRLRHVGWRPARHPAAAVPCAVPASHPTCRPVQGGAAGSSVPDMSAPPPPPRRLLAAPYKVCVFRPPPIQYIHNTHRISHLHQTAPERQCIPSLLFYFSCLASAARRTESEKQRNTTRPDRNPALSPNWDPDSSPTEAFPPGGLRSCYSTYTLPRGPCLHPTLRYPASSSQHRLACYCPLDL